MSGSITAWLNLLRDGNELAAEKLWDYFAPNLHGKIASQCRDLRICDEEDIVVTAFYRLIAAMQNDQRYPVTDRQEFWRLLIAVSNNTIGDWRKYDKATRRGGQVKILQFDSSADSHPSVHESVHHRSDSDLIGQLREMAQKMDRPEYAQVIELKQKGLTNEAVAQQIGFSLRTVQYIIQDIKEAWSSTFETQQRRAA